MKKISVITINTGLYNEWTGVEHIEVDMDLNTLLEVVNLATETRNLFVKLKRINGVIAITNVNYIVDAWEKEIRE